MLTLLRRFNRWCVLLVLCVATCGSAGPIERIKHSIPSNHDVNINAVALATTPNDTGWAPQSSGTTATLYWVKAVDGNVGWAGGTGGVVIRTTNGGTTWTSVGGGAIGPADIYTGDAVDANIAFVSTSPSGTRIYRTTNGGGLWTQVYTASSGFIDGIQMTSATTGYAVGDPVSANWVLLKTTNGGATWGAWATLAQVGAEAGWNNSFQVLDSNVWFGTNNTKIYHSTDLGASWSVIPIPFANALCFHFNSPMVGEIGSDAGSNYGTTNGGLTWTAGALAGTGQLLSISGVLGTEFWMSSSAGGIYYTTNLGGAWTTLPPNGYPGVAGAISLVSPGTGGTYGWATDGSGIILRYRRISSDVRDDINSLPEEFVLSQNYPNPFNPTTTIKYDLPTGAHVKLSLFDVLGQQVSTLVDEDQRAGYRSVNWSASNVASGVYFYRIEAGKFVKTRRLLLLR